MSTTGLVVAFAAGILGVAALSAGERLRPLGRVSLAGALFAAVLFGFLQFRDQRAVGGLAEIIDPVPEVTTAVHVPTPGPAQLAGSVSGGGWLRHSWGLRTSLRPARVLDYYRLPEHRRRWAVMTMGPRSLALEREGATLDIIVSDEVDESLVWYFYEPPKRVSGGAFGR